MDTGAKFCQPTPWSHSFFNTEDITIIETKREKREERGREKKREKKRGTAHTCISVCKSVWIYAKKMKATQGCRTCKSTKQFARVAPIVNRAFILIQRHRKKNRLRQTTSLLSELCANQKALPWLRSSTCVAGPAWWQTKIRASYTAHTCCWPASF